VVVGLVLGGLAGCGSKSLSQPQTGVPTMYVIDSGMSGWVKIVYRLPDEKELPVLEGFAVARIPPDQKLFTRSRMNPSWEGAKFFYQTPDGKRVELPSADNDSRRIWGQDKTTDAAGERETFFVGDQQQFSQSFKAQKSFGGGLWQPGADSDQAKPADPNKTEPDLPKK
jgi:hypothetical protein